MELKDKVALVTGAGKRIGYQLASKLARNGVRVAIHYASSSRGAEELAREIQATGGDARVFRADLTSADETEHLADEVTRAMGPYSILINNAAIFAHDDIDNFSQASWLTHINVNTLAPLLLARKMRQHMPPNTGGKIVNINDWHTARANYLSYGVSKAALAGLTKSLAVGLAPDIQVNQVELGQILPPSSSGNGDDDQPAHGRDNRHIGATKLVKRNGTADEVAETVLFLLTNDYLTGESIRITGGIDVW